VLTPSAAVVFSRTSRGARLDGCDRSRDGCDRGRGSCGREPRCPHLRVVTLLGQNDSFHIALRGRLPGSSPLRTRRVLVAIAGHDMQRVVLAATSRGYRHRLSR